MLLPISNGYIWKIIREIMQNIIRTKDVNAISKKNPLNKEM